MFGVEFTLIAGEGMFFSFLPDPAFTLLFKLVMCPALTGSVLAGVLYPPASGILHKAHPKESISCVE